MAALRDRFGGGRRLVGLMIVLTRPDVNPGPVPGTKSAPGHGTTPGPWRVGVAGGSAPGRQVAGQARTIASRSRRKKAAAGPGTSAWPGGQRLVNGLPGET